MTDHGYPPAFDAPIGHPQPGYPPAPRTNTAATLSLVFAFLFAPIGAFLGHRALGQIARTHEGGRNRAVIGMALSYLVLALVVTVLVGGALRSAGGNGPSATTAAPSAQQDRLSDVLLSVEDVRTIIKLPDLTDAKSEPTKKPNNSTGQTRADPPECVGVAAAGIDSVYDGSGVIASTRTSFTDKGTGTMVDQAAAQFDSAAAAQAFVTKSRTQWQQCGGKEFVLSGASGSLTWTLGTPGGADARVTVINALSAGAVQIPQGRVLAGKGDIVIDISVVSLTASTGAGTIADKILARIPA